MKRLERSGCIQWRPYQVPVFDDRQSGILILHWSRQIGKSFTLAAWAVDRVLTQMDRHGTWLVTVLSNSRENGAEFLRKCAEVCRLIGMPTRVAAGGSSLPAPPTNGGHGQRGATVGATTAENRVETTKVSAELDEGLGNLPAEALRMEVRIRLDDVPGAPVGRIKVLAANPRTARGFSGDLILDEFAFHEDSAAIWEAAEPILAAHPEYLCRIASTGNGKYNLFYRMVTSGQFKVSRVSRTESWRLGVPIYDPNTRRPTTPAAARAGALNKRAYDQNYELAFMDENMALLTAELISAAEPSSDSQQPAVRVSEQAWSDADLDRLGRTPNRLYVGNDIGRNRDLSVVTVIERVGALCRVVGMLRMDGLRLPEQQAQLDRVCGLPNFAGYEGDLTGLGLGLVEWLQERWGSARVRGVNFSSVEPIPSRWLGEPGRAETARVTEIMAVRLLELFEDRAIEIPVDAALREDLRRPEKLTSPTGRVSIAATRDEAGHADHFWSLALAVRAAAPDRCPGGTVVRVGRTRAGPANARRRCRWI